MLEKKCHLCPSTGNPARPQLPQPIGRSGKHEPETQGALKKTGFRFRVFKNTRLLGTYSGINMREL